MDFKHRIKVRGVLESVRVLKWTNNKPIYLVLMHIAIPRAISEHNYSFE